MSDSVYNCHYPFGMLMEERSNSYEDYRFGFQGQEQDDEAKGHRVSIVFKYRIHDARIGRFISLDPLSSDYPWNSPYAFAENRVLDGTDIEGAEWVHYKVQYQNTSEGIQFLEKTTVADFRSSSEESMNSLHNLGGYKYIYIPGDLGPASVVKVKQPNFYEKYSKGFGIKGQGILYTYEEVDKNGNFLDSYDEWEIREDVTHHGFFAGSGCVKKFGPEQIGKAGDNGYYDFDALPLDQPDALAKIHDMEMDVSSFGSWTDYEWIAADINFVQGLGEFLGNAMNPDYIDPYTGRKPSDQAVAFASKAKTLFETVVTAKMVSAGVAAATGKISHEEYEVIREKYESGYANIETLPTPSNEQLHRGDD